MMKECAFLIMTIISNAEVLVSRDFHPIHPQYTVLLFKLFHLRRGLFLITGRHNSPHNLGKCDRATIPIFDNCETLHPASIG